MATTRSVCCAICSPWRRRSSGCCWAALPRPPHAAAISHAEEQRGELWKEQCCHPEPAPAPRAVCAAGILSGRERDLLFFCEDIGSGKLGFVAQGFTPDNKGSNKPGALAPDGPSDSSQEEVIRSGLKA